MQRQLRRFHLRRCPHAATGIQPIVTGKCDWPSDCSVIKHVEIQKKAKR